MKVLTILGTRPEIIRLSRIIPKLDELCEHVLVHTGQNYDTNLNAIFMKQLGVREPDHQLDATGSFGEQVGTILEELEDIIGFEEPDAFLVLGDTNSSLGAIMAKRKGVRVFHMEAGNRCFDDRVPEETNRRLIDHSSDILLPYTERSRQNLLDEGIHSSRIYVTGNPIKEVLDYYMPMIEAEKDRAKEYYLITLHRAENVDNPDRLQKFVQAFNQLDKPVIWSVHPHTRKMLDGLKLNKNIELSKPMGLFEFVKLEKNAYCVLSDSGTVQEECAIFGVPVVTLRDSTERPETVESGSNFISGCEPESILKGIEVVTRPGHKQAPSDYFVRNVSDTVVKIVLGYYKPRKDV